MKMLFLLLGSGIFILRGHAGPVTAKADTTAPRILILNAYDASEMKARKNKKELFAELADSLKHCLRSEIVRYSAFEAVVAEEPMSDTAGLILHALLQKYNCARAVVINNLNVYFERTDVEVTKNDDGSKSRVASYDICSEVQYWYYGNAVAARVFDRKRCEFFGKRNMASGMLATGPDIVGKSKYAFIAIRQNAAMEADELIYLLKKE